MTGEDADAGERPLRLLFFTGSAKYLRHYETLIDELAARGYRVHVVFERTENPVEEALAARVTRHEEVTEGQPPERSRFDGWRPLAHSVRQLADLARYSHARYDAAPVLRKRTARRAVERLSGSRRQEPIGALLASRLARRLASTSDTTLSERVVGRMARLEALIPTSAPITDYIRNFAPDAVLVAPGAKYSHQIDYLKSARSLGIRTAILVASWDNLTVKGLLKFVPTRVFVWNDAQRVEAVELHGMPAERVVATGAQLLDDWFERRPTLTRQELAAETGLTADRQYVLYLCSSQLISQGNELEFVRSWIAALRRSDDARLREAGILVRPHPNARKRWLGVDLGDPNAVIWPAPDANAHPAFGEGRASLYDSIVYSSAVVGINTTAMIEAAILGKRVLTILSGDFVQESSFHFHHLLRENGGFLEVAASFDEHCVQLASVLADAESKDDTAAAFVRSFIRPHGLDRAVTPLFADFVEELPQLDDVKSQPPLFDRVVLRPLLTLEAGLSSVRMAGRHSVRPLRLRLAALRKRARVTSVPSQT